MQSQWSICPPDILKRCFCTQLHADFGSHLHSATVALDYIDNAAGACVCKLWRETFRGGQITELEYGTLRSQPDPIYLHQFANVTTDALTVLPSMVGRKDWLGDQAGFNQEHADVPIWIEAVQALPATCTKLTLDCQLPGTGSTGFLDFNTLTDTFSQLSSLRHFNIQDDSGANVEIQALSSLTNLEVLELLGRRCDSKIGLVGSLQALPPSITRLKLSDCQRQHTKSEPDNIEPMVDEFEPMEYVFLETLLDPGHKPFSPEFEPMVAEFESMVEVADLAHLKLKDLDLSHSIASFGHTGSLSLLTRLVFNRTVAINSIPVNVLALSGLHVLCLRDSPVVGFDESPIGLLHLLSHLRCLQEFDIIGCPDVVISPGDCQQVQIASLAFSYAQLSDPDNSHFEHFVTHQGCSSGVGMPFLRMDGRLPYCDQNWNSELPFAALQHLTISGAHVWPGAFSYRSQSCWPNLAVLDVRFATHARSPPNVVLSLDSRIRLRELYIAESSYILYELAACTTLRVVGILNKEARVHILQLPPFLTDLTLHNVLSRDTPLGLLPGLSELTSIKLGGSRRGRNCTTQLPSLPQSIVELDLWDGLLTDLQQLTRLTNLKKLLMPDPPTEDQLQIIRQLPHLRHLDVTGRAGMPCYPSTSAVADTSYAGNDCIIT